MTDGQQGPKEASASSSEPSQAPPEKGAAEVPATGEPAWYRSFDRRLQVLALLIGVPAALGGLLSLGQVIVSLFHEDPPTFHVVLDPRADVGGVALLPVSASVKPVQHLRAGTPVTIDCVKTVLVGGNGTTNVYARIAPGEIYGGAWVDGMELFTREGKPMLDAIPDIPDCPSDS